jgi:hypothetical protein
MRPFLALLGVGLAIGAFCTRPAGADPQPPGKPSPQPPGKPAEPSPAKPAAPQPGRPHWAYPPGWSPYWAAYPYYSSHSWPGYWYGPGYPSYAPYYDGPIVLPPLYLPAEVLYGPEAVKRFMGLDRWNVPRDGAGPRPSPAREVEERKPPSQRATSPETIALARRFIGFGDKMFGDRKYADANERYRMASQVAPGLADAFFRQGLALVATRRYESAAKALKRGLELDARWPKSDFRLDSLYGEHEADKAAHIDMLATAARNKPQDADLLFLTGICLWFDGQAERAGPFFQRAGQLGVEQPKHLKAFEPPPPRQPDAEGPF